MRVRIQAPELKEKSGLANTKDIKITDLETGCELANGIRSMTIRLEPGEVVRAEAVIYIAQAKINALLEWVAQDPSTAEIKPVKRIEFADGSVWTNGDN